MSPSRPQDPTITLLVDPDELLGTSLEVRDQSYRHLFRSRRLAVGDPLRVVDGLGSARAGRITSIDRKRATVELGGLLPSNEPRTRLHLRVGALRPERADWLVEKATELGVYSITFVATERTPRLYGENRLERLKRVASSAVEQSRRSRRPEIQSLGDPQLLLGDPVPTHAYFLHPEGHPVTSLSRDPTPVEPVDVTVWIGPEGGFSDTEARHLRQQGVEPVTLGSSILRVETAAVAACVLWLQALAPPQSLEGEP